MNIENIVISLELSKELKELGFPQDDGLFWWVPGSIEVHSHYDAELQVANDTPMIIPSDEYSLWRDCAPIEDNFDTPFERFFDDTFSTAKKLLEKVYAAPTAEELMLYIPDMIKSTYKDLHDNETSSSFKLSISKDEVSYSTLATDGDAIGPISFIAYANETRIYGKSLTENIARLLIWLVKNGHVEFK